MLKPILRNRIKNILEPVLQTEKNGNGSANLAISNIITGAPVIDAITVYPFALTKYGSNPILDIGSGGSWDETYVTTPTVLKISSSDYRMWYSGLSSGYQIGYATSSDGVTWTKYGSNPVLSGNAGQWDENDVFDPAVILDGSTYKMWYCGHDTGASYEVGYATSNDGISWTKYPGNPVLNPTPASWDETGILYISVILDGSTYKMWYIGRDTIGDRKIGYATSSDGVTWTKYGSNPVLDVGSGGSWDDANLTPVFVYKQSSIYKMYYGATDGSNYRTGYATSNDGISWTKYPGNPVLDLGTGGSWDDSAVSHPCAVESMVYYAGNDGTNYRIGIAYI